MSGLIAGIRQLFAQVAFWVTVQPWEQALRVRAGKHLRRLAPGFHLRIPIIDVVHRQTVRRRNCLIATHDGATLVVGASLGYAIADIEKLYQGLHDAEDTLRQMTAAAIARAVLDAPRAALAPEKLNGALSAELGAQFGAYGLHGVELRLTDFAFIRAIRLIQDKRWGGDAALNVGARA
jgi:regulator of protease activity HflC (stomatin/prohibitin superfamily)